MTTGDVLTLVVEQLSYRVSDQDGTQILRDVSFSISGGRVAVIIGPSGSGKSTLIRLIPRLMEPSAGRILVAGKDVNGLDPLQLRRMVSLVPQKPFMFPGTVYDNLLMPWRYRGEAAPPADAQFWQELLAMCQIPKDLLQRDSSTLSLGQQQRVAIARAVGGEPQVLLLDEPTSALDRPTVEALGKTLRRITVERNLATLLVTHDLHFAQQVADDLILLQDGQIATSGPAKELFREGHSERLQAFLVGSSVG